MEVVLLWRTDAGKLWHRQSGGWGVPGVLGVAREECVNKKEIPHWGVLYVEYWPSIEDGQGSIPSTTKKQITKGEK